MANRIGMLLMCMYYARSLARYCVYRIEAAIYERHHGDMLYSMELTSRSSY